MTPSNTQRFNLKAIAVATALVFVLDSLTGIFLFLAFGADQLQTGATQENIRAVAERIQGMNGYLLVSLAVGTMTTVLGGYAAGRMAKQLPLLNACAVGVIGIAIGVILGNPGEAPWWFDAIGYLTNVPAAIVGGHLARQRNRANQ